MLCKQLSAHIIQKGLRYEMMMMLVIMNMMVMMTMMMMMMMMMAVKTIENEMTMTKRTLASSDISD